VRILKKIAFSPAMREDVLDSKDNIENLKKLEEADILPLIDVYTKERWPQLHDDVLWAIIKWLGTDQLYDQKKWRLFAYIDWSKVSDATMLKLGKMDIMTHLQWFDITMKKFGDRQVDEQVSAGEH